ncbi:hypothetical protein [Corallococcus sicarius]|uniref:hypothetical protein n=1 Tax=Corallococcus sicarius TaxID=2316726 RepID=UPI000EA1A95E|nr:hypothetical protein [Corallococcus sicarius]
MTFRARNLSPDEFAALGLDTSALIYPQGGPGSDGYLLKREDVASKQGTLSGQAIYYWLRATGTVGTVRTWALVPVVYFLSEGVHALVNLDGLQVSFKVMLSMLPTTPTELEALVDQGVMPPSVLQTLSANGFNQAAFSLQRLFLDFDTVDFTQWALKPVAGSTQVDVILVEPNQYLSQSLTSLTQNNQDFTSSFSNALQYAFGMNGQNTDGATPYILGINAQSNHPATTNPGAPPSLVPTYIGFGTSANATDDGLSTLNYQVLGGDNPQARVPKKGDGSVVYVTDTLVTNNNYSGSLLFAESAFFEPLVFQPIQQAFGSAPSLWKSQGTTMTVTDSAHVTELDNEQTVLGEGLKQKVTMDATRNCTVTVSGNTINISGSFYQRQDITISMVVLTAEIPFHWWMWCTVSFQQQITLAIDSNNQLVFNMGPMTTTTDGPPRGRELRWRSGQRGLPSLLGAEPGLLRPHGGRPRHGDQRPRCGHAEPRGWNERQPHREHGEQLHLSDGRRLLPQCSAVQQRPRSADGRHLPGLKRAPPNPRHVGLHAAPHTNRAGPHGWRHLSDPHRRH